MASRFADTLKRLLDSKVWDTSGELDNLRCWAQFIGNTDVEIGSWLADSSFPSVEALGMIMTHFEHSTLSPDQRQAVEAMWGMMYLPLNEVTPLAEQIYRKYRMFFFTISAYYLRGYYENYLRELHKAGDVRDEYHIGQMVVELIERELQRKKGWKPFHIIDTANRIDMEITAPRHWDAFLERMNKRREMVLPLLYRHNENSDLLIMPVFGIGEKFQGISLEEWVENDWPKGVDYWELK